MKLHTRYQGVSQPFQTGTRVAVNLDNGMRNARIRVKVRGQVTVAGGPAALAKNGGSLFAAFTMSLTENGRDTFTEVPGLLFKQLAESDAGQPLDFARLPDNAAIGTYDLHETFDLGFARSRQAVPRETSYLDQNQNQPFQVRFRRLANAALNLADDNGNTVTLGDITAEVEQVWSPAPGEPLPLFKPGSEVLELQVAGAASLLPLDLKISERVSDLVFAAFAEDADGATVLAPAGDIINALAMYGSGQGEEIIGPEPVPYGQLVNGQREYAGGDVAFLNAMYQHSFMPTGMLSDTIDPRRFRNLRAYFNCQPLAGGSNTRIVVLARTLTSPPPVGAWAMVVPPAQLPGWVAG